MKMEGAYYCYIAVGLDDVILDDTETYSILGEEWNCKELKIEKNKFEFA